MKWLVEKTSEGGLKCDELGFAGDSGIEGVARLLQIAARAVSDAPLYRHRLRVEDAEGGYFLHLISSEA